MYMRGYEKIKNIKKTGRENLMTVKLFFSFLLLFALFASNQWQNVAYNKLIEFLINPSVPQ